MALELLVCENCRAKVDRLPAKMTNTKVAGETYYKYTCSTDPRTAAPSSLLHQAWNQLPGTTTGNTWKCQHIKK